MTPAKDAQLEFTLRLDTAGIRRLYPKVREALLGVGYQLTDTVDVMRVLERLIAASIERDAKRLQVCVHALGNGTQIEVIDRRRVNPRDTLPSEIVPREVARASGASRVGVSGGLVLWALVDLPPVPSA
jgi:hypothetical protein